MDAIYIRFGWNILRLFGYFLFWTVVAVVVMGQLEPVLPTYQIVLMVGGVMLPMFLTGTTLNLLLIYYGTNQPEIIIWAMETEDGKTSLIFALMITFTVLYFIFSLLYREIIFVPFLAAYGL